MKFYRIFAIYVPIALMVVSALVASLIPGCEVDEGAGASQACGSVGEYLAFGSLGGLCWLIIGLMGLVPLVIVSVFKRIN